MPGGLIDLHCHILPGVDDGALDLADSVAMARVAHAGGATTICATPHIRHDHDVRIAQLPGRVAALQDALDAAGVEVHIAAGGEVAETIVDELTDAELHALALGGGRWILLEPRPGPLSDSLPATVERLHERGLRALVAHPERHLGEDLPERLAALIAQGALVQATAAYFEHDPHAAGMRTLAERGLVHVLGSDAHSSHGGRPVALAGAVAALAGIPRTAAHTDWIARQAPAAILAGDVVQPPFAAG